ncbi:vitamin B12 transporter [Lutibacter sp. Hel_I_33_5]|uniref:TonB-dependent receptor plug domain-containing protein n=1 Tax=Lutibacter sp. Hel_I_33_5 TaxID=1566289 RepID=UPI00119FC4E4|nr:TonB-dependent receptor [Lutibacter sp. Hel_I_33_5]TVZ55066.1 vitamin B12 transporter [Lutibacter sp. Hel_I_33_5]
MKKQLLIVSVLACSFVNSNLFSQDLKEKEKVEKLGEVVVTATKFALKKEHTGKVIYQISQKEISNNAGKTVIDLLNNLPGIDVRGVNTNPSEPRSTYVRGGRARQVLVLIDGVPVSDPSGINQEYDLRLLSLNQIEKIEVLKGASSTLYGSGAATGVINIILKKATKKEITGTYEVSLGTNNTATVNNAGFQDMNQNASVNGTLGNFNFLTSLNVSGIDGMSAAKSKTAANFDADKYYSRNGLLKVGYQFSKKVALTSFYNFDKFNYDFDAGAFNDSDINNGNQSQFRVGVKPSFKYKNGQAYVLASINQVKRNLEQYNSFSKATDEYQFNGRSLNLDVVNKIDLNDFNLQLITGVNYQKHDNNTITPFGKIDPKTANFNTIDPYVSLVYIADNGLSLNAGGRYNMHSAYGNHFVYDANAAYNVIKSEDGSIKALASYSTAFIAPSLYQLYDGFSGNADLKPESNETFEIGFEGNIKDIVNLDVVYFNRKEKDAIIYDNTTFKYGNGSSNANGIEVNAKIAPAKFIDVNIGYTYTDKDLTDDFDDYIPRHKIVVSTDINAYENLFLNVGFRNVGERTLFDRWGSFGTAGTDVILPSYNLLDINANYTLLEGTVTFFGGITNLLNEDYDDIIGYSTRGRNFKFGLRLKF